MKKALAIITALFSFLGLTLLTIPTVRADVFGPPYYAAFYGYDPQGGGCGGNDIYQYPFADFNNGRILVHTRTHADGCGGYDIDTWEGFWGPTFTVPTAKNYDIIYSWQLWWDAAIVTSACYLTSSNAAAYIYIGGNLFDVTARGWMHNGDVHLRVFDLKLGCGPWWSDHADGANYHLHLADFGCCPLIPGQTYQFYTFIITWTQAEGWGAGANAMVNLGTDGDVGYAISMAFP